MKGVIFRGRDDKMAAMAAVFRKYLRGRILDIGCDAMYLAPAVLGRYVGADIVGSPHVLLDANVRLPFRDRAFDTVVAFDVLEHLNYPHTAFDELCRVSRMHVIVGLPNIYEWHIRLTFLLKATLGEKYRLTTIPSVDRHRWVFGLSDACRFVRHRAVINGYRVAGEVVAYYAYKQPLARLVTALARLMSPLGAHFLAYHYWALLVRAESA